MVTGNFQWQEKQNKLCKLLLHTHNSSVNQDAKVS